ncbi:dihydrofolate reductase [Acuticoccus sp.]|uniref:dihydrofolate reductase n=1 Tax=Acuticoccus sp. TaxID=1904378 RepID=UPI003B528127
MVAAVARNGVIGRDGALPWDLPTDRRHFRALTLGRTVVMGRRTFEEIGVPLKGRRNIVVTSQPLAGVETAPTLAAALASAGDDLALIGGHRIYAEGMAFAETIHLTRVHAEPEGDTVFPAIPKRFRLAGTRPGTRSPSDEHAFHHETYVRLPGDG